jgi:hypothetical protein
MQPSSGWVYGQPVLIVTCKNGRHAGMTGEYVGVEEATGLYIVRATQDGICTQATEIQHVQTGTVNI